MHHCTSLSVGFGVDYDGQTFYATFEPNDTQSNISITINNDTAVEPLEFFSLVIHNDFPPGFWRYNPHEASVYIKDDDCK